jgi:phage recombination protein Bet
LPASKSRRKLVLAFARPRKVATLMNFVQPTDRPFLSNDQIDLLKQTSLLQFRPEEQATFIEICQRTWLDPFTGQIHATKRGKKEYVSGEEVWIQTLVPVVSYEGLIYVADRTGQYDGNEIAWAADEVGEDGEPIWRKAWLPLRGYPALARAIVYHKQHKYPEVAVAEWGAYAAYKRDGQTLQDFWRRMPDLMLSKCALALALRRAFPNQLGALYIPEELGAETESKQPTAAAPAETFKNATNVVPIRTTPPTEEEKALRQEAKTIPPRQQENPVPPREQPPEPPAGETTPTTPPVATAQSPESPATLAETEAATESEDPPIPDDPDWWKEHVIMGIRDERFKKKTVSSFSTTTLLQLKRSWLSQVRPRWAEASKIQKLDAFALEAAISAQGLDSP